MEGKKMRINRQEKRQGGEETRRDAYETDRLGSGRRQEKTEEKGNGVKRRRKRVNRYI